jgi:hypothetical protein
MMKFGPVFLFFSLIRVLEICMYLYMCLHAFSKTPAYDSRTCISQDTNKLDKTGRGVYAVALGYDVSNHSRSVNHTMDNEDDTAVVVQGPEVCA